MNIVYLTNQFPPNIWGGMGIVVDFLTKHIIKEHNVSVYTTNSGTFPLLEDKGALKVYRPVLPFFKRILQRKKSNGYYTIFLNIVKIIDLFFNNLSCFFLLRKHYKERQYDLIVVHDFMHSLAGILCKIFLKLPVVFHVHFIEYTATKSGKAKDPLRIIKFFEQTLAKKSNSIIVGSREMKKIMVEHKWEQDKIQVVPLCNAFEEYENAARRMITYSDNKVDLDRLQLNLDPGDKVILFVGRLIYLKGVYTLIESFRHVVNQEPHAKLFLIGEGNRKKLEARVREFGLEKHVYISHKFLPVKELLDYYRLADICVFPSMQEPFGLVALEAMSMGKPVILGEGFSKIFQGDRFEPNVLYVNGFDYDSIATCILDVLQNEEQASRMGLRAQKYITDYFKPEVVIENTLKIYQNVINLTNN